LPVHKNVVMVKCHIDRAVAIRSQHADVPFAKRLQHLDMRMTEQIVPATGDDGEPRDDRIEQQRRRRRAAAMMRRLEHVGASALRCDARLFVALDIAGQ